MKKILLTLAGSLMIGMCALHAQENDPATQDRARTRDGEQYGQPKQKRDRTKMHRDQQWNDQSRNRDAYANEGMVIIDKNEMPSSLQEKLKDEKYAGWENGTIYHNTNTGEYVIAPRAFRFDDQGNEIEGEYTSGNSSGNDAYGDRPGRKGRYSNDQNSQYQNGATESRQQPAQRRGQNDEGETTTPDATDQSQQSDRYRSGQQSDQQPSNNYNNGQSQSDQSQSGQTPFGQTDPGKSQSVESQKSSTQNDDDQ